MPVSWQMSETTFGWELEEGYGEIRLVLLLGPGFKPTRDEAAAIGQARLLTDDRSGGWRYSYTKGLDPVLPWNPEMSPGDHSRLWVELLQEHAVAPR